MLVAAFGVVCAVVMLVPRDSKRAKVGAPRAQALQVPIGVELCRSPGFSIKRIAVGESATRMMKYGEKQFTVEAYDLLVVLARTYRVYSARLDLRADLPEGDYDMTIPVDSMSEAAGQAALSMAMREAFGLKLYLRDQPTDVWLLTWSKPGVPAGLTPAADTAKRHQSTTAKGYEFQASTIDELADFMEDHMDDRPVVNETHLPKKYDFSLPAHVLFDPATLPEEVRNLGLEVLPGRRTTKMLVVERE